MNKNLPPRGFEPTISQKIKTAYMAYGYITSRPCGRTIGMAAIIDIFFESIHSEFELNELVRNEQKSATPGVRTHDIAKNKNRLHGLRVYNQ